MQGKVEICGVNTARLKVLSSQETRELLVRSHQGDKQAREELLNSVRDDVKHETAKIIREYDNIAREEKMENVYTLKKAYSVLTDFVNNLPLAKSTKENLTGVSLNETIISFRSESQHNFTKCDYFFRHLYLPLLSFTISTASFTSSLILLRASASVVQFFIIHLLKLFSGRSVSPEFPTRTVG